MLYRRAVFLDTKVLLAFVDSSHDYYNIAVTWFEDFFAGKFQDSYDRLVTSDYVISEVSSILFKPLRTKGGYFQNLIDIVSKLIYSPSIKILHVNENIFNRGWHNLEKYYKDFNLKLTLVDTTTLSICRSSSIKAIFSFNPIFHVLHELLRMDINPDPVTESDSLPPLRYDIIPHQFNYKKSFPSVKKNILTSQAKALLDLQNTGWKIHSLSKNDQNLVIGLQLCLSIDSSDGSVSNYPTSWPKSFKNFIYLKELNISGNNLVSAPKKFFTSLANLSNLQSLVLSENGFSKLPESLIPLQKTGCQIII
ncbi:MAG: PIN domain-containing protein [Candidatus Hodarchaeales archaeon]